MERAPAERKRRLDALVGDLQVGDRVPVAEVQAQVRAALAAVAAAQFVIIIPALLGHAGGGTPMHSSRELGVFNLALAVGFAVAALRPALARGMLPVAGFASAALIVLSFVDSALSYTTIPAETPHLITLLGKIACRDNFTEMHALKHHQATYEEFHATRPSLRWRHLVAAVQAAAISHGRIQDIYEHAAEVMHF